MYYIEGIAFNEDSDMPELGNGRKKWAGDITKRGKVAPVDCPSHNGDEHQEQRRNKIARA